MTISLCTSLMKYYLCSISECSPNPYLPCEPTGADVLERLDFNPHNLWWDILFLLLLYLLINIASCVFFSIRMMRRNIWSSNWKTYFIIQNLNSIDQFWWINATVWCWNGNLLFRNIFLMFILNACIYVVYMWVLMYVYVSL